MDWFFDLLDRIIQNRIWALLLDHFQWVDWVTALMLLVGIIYGFKEGLFRTLALNLEGLAVLWLVFHFEKKFTLVLQNNLTFIKSNVAKPVSFLMLLILFWLIFMLMDGRLKTVFHTKFSGPWKQTGGIIGGGFFLLLVWSLVAQILVSLPFRKVQNSFRAGGSASGEKVAALAPEIYRALQGFPEKKEKK